MFTIFYTVNFIFYILYYIFYYIYYIYIHFMFIFYIFLFIQYIKRIFSIKLKSFRTTLRLATLPTGKIYFIYKAIFNPIYLIL